MQFAGEVDKMMAGPQASCIKACRDVSSGAHVNRSDWSSSSLQELDYVVTNSANRKEKIHLLTSVSGCLYPGEMAALVRGSQAGAQESTGIFGVSLAAISSEPLTIGFVCDGSSRSKTAFSLPVWTCYKDLRVQVLA